MFHFRFFIPRLGDWDMVGGEKRKKLIHGFSHKMNNHF